MLSVNLLNDWYEFEQLEKQIRLVRPVILEMLVQDVKKRGLELFDVIFIL